MKNKLKTLLLVAVTITFTHCQREEANEPLAPQATLTNEPVSFNEAKNLFEATQAKSHKGSSSARPTLPPVELQPHWDYFRQTQTPQREFYSKVPITVVGADLDVQALFVKQNGHTEHYLFITEVDNLTSDNRIVNADFYLLSPTGIFISAYRMTDGHITHKLVPKEKGTYQLAVENTKNRLFYRAKRGMHFLKVYEENDSEPENFDEEESAGDSRHLGKGNVSGSKGGSSNNNNNNNNDYGDFHNDIELEEVVVVGKRKYKTEYPYYEDPYKSFRKYENPEYKEPKMKKSDIGLSIIKSKKDGGGSSGNDARPEEKITDSLTSPCAKAVLNEIPKLKDDIANIIREVFDSNHNFNITFFEDDKLKNTTTDGYCKVVNMDSISGNVNIFLNPDILNNATKEFILVTMYHEALHGYLSYEKERLGDDFEKKYPNVYFYNALSMNNGIVYEKFQFLESKKGGHFKFAPFIDKLVEAVHSFNPNLPLNTAKAMAKSGIVRDMFDWEVQLNQNEREGNKNKKGTKCIP